MTVEECLTVDVNRLLRHGLLDRWPTTGTIRWYDTRTGERTSSVSYTRRHINEDSVILQLSYAITRGSGEKDDVEMAICMTTTRPTFGGRRWWFQCPLVVGGIPCSRRVTKLHSPPGGLYFGCRHCYDLTYRSCQESHRWTACSPTLQQKTGSASPM
jgi:hypothetical protein